MFHIKKVQGLNAVWGLSVQSLHALPVPVWVFPSALAAFYSTKACIGLG